MLEKVRRRRIALPESGPEIALIDWGGHGPLALLHHANGFCAALWDLVARSLRLHFRVIGMDARGHGDSSKPEGEKAYRWELFASDLAFVARVLADEHGGRVAVGIGHSFGGTATAMAAADHPDLFERLVLVDPVFPPKLRDAQRLARAGGMAETARQRTAVWPDRDAAREKWSGKDLFAAWRPEALEIYLAEGLADRPDGRVELKCRPETEAAIFATGPLFDAWSLAPRVKTPARLLWASRGNFPRSIYEGLARSMQQGSVVTLDAGHLVPMEQPELVVREVLAFAGQDSTG